MKFTTHYTQAETKEVATRLLPLLSPQRTHATVVGLSGELGAGKTTLTQAFADLLGVKEHLQSPTFVIAKFYPTAHDAFEALVHVDAYRIESTDELLPLGWQEIISRPNTLVVVEWPERIHAALPNDTHYISIAHTDEGRTIVYD